MPTFPVLGGTYYYGGVWWAPVQNVRQNFGGLSLDFHYLGWFVELGLADSWDYGNFDWNHMRILPILQAGYLLYFDFYR